MYDARTHVGIRRFLLEDVPLKIEWINDPENNAYLHYDIPLSYEKTCDWFRGKNDAVREDCVIEYEGIPVGLIGLLAIDRVNRKAEFYISMGDTRYKRKGISTAATLLMLEHAFGELGLNKVYLNVDAENLAACGLYEKTGFRCEGIFREDLLHRGRLVDRKRYAIRKQDFGRRRAERESNGKPDRDTGRPTNLLVLSAGTRNKVVQYFRRALTAPDGTRTGKVIATDMSDLAPAIYEADQYYLVPRMTEPGYLDVILDICRREEVAGVLSLIDPELSLLAAHEDEFRALGTEVIGSSYELCERALDKFQMYRWLEEHGYRCARSYMDREKFYADVEAGRIGYPVFVKPARGSASIAISKVYDRETVELLFSHQEGLMIQEFLEGQEIGADVYIDLLSGDVVSVFTKKKIKMRAGETDKAVSFRDERLLALIERFVGESGFRGQIDIDLFEIDGAYYISEVNPRFGGGYPHAYECDCDHMKLIVNNLRGVVNERQACAYEEGVHMMKYNEIMIRR